MRHDPQSRRFRAALLSASLLLSEAGAVSATLPELADAFPHESQTSIQSFMTIGSAAVTVCTLLAGALAGRLGKRRLTLLGMALMAVAGMAPLVLVPLGNFGALLASRIVLGIGMGFVQPLSASVIADFYRGKEREDMLGWQSAAVGLGGVIWNLLVGLLVLWDWKAAFLVYGVGLACMGLYARYVPEPPGRARPEKVRAEVVRPEEVRAEPAAATPRWYRLPADAWLAAGLMLVFTAGYQGLIISMPLAFTAEKHLVAASTVPWIMTFFALASVAAGLIFGTAVRRLRNWTGTASALVLAVSMALCAGADSALTGYVAAVLAGLGFGVYMPFLVTETNNRSTPEASAMATALLFTGAAVGTALAPYILGIAGTLDGDERATAQLLVAAVVLTAVALLTTLRYVRTGRAAVPAAAAHDLEKA
ncbi:MFS transporter [Streptomyces sp. LP11]|uniref:MFS transporter n=1 Tax=Streptomyces pyxinicus TaxID=2970331 RepID=A0ABT2ATZ8_9ACTN|nr:MFS transporter [Streptomyces sp. LP11]MCS0599719.1 MFS transporter [Streptomyces sp. LP11]